MKYIKKYQDISIEYKTNAEKLLMKVKNIFEKLNFIPNYDKRINEIRFYKDNIWFSIRIYINWNITDEKYETILTITVNQNFKNEILQFIPEYFKNINNINLIDYNYNLFYSYKIEPENLNDVIKQISLKDFIFKLNANKYNI